MNFNHFRSFISIADHGSFSKAAKAMHISTQALLQQIQLLEQSVGASLFYRNFQGVTLTPAGEHLYEGAKHLLVYAESLRKRCHETSFIGDKLLIGTSHEITSTFLYQISYEFKNAFPEIELDIVYTDSNYRFAELMDKKFDLCESFYIRTIEQYGLDFFPILESIPYCIVSKTHPLARKEKVCTADLEGQTILLSTSQTDCFGNEQIEAPSLGVTYKRYHDFISRKLETAMGNAIYFDYLLAEDEADMDLFVAIPYETSPYTFGFVHRANPSPVVTSFLKIAEKCSTESSAQK
ncbi:MAG: LysR family transcriptional regulator [Clostridiales bacterium]|jgi:DNA-binding transcriptional LysR family regulator|nr:LysR family transcriptional regulator [Clostridiales bacterium]